MKEKNAILTEILPRHQKSLDNFFHDHQIITSKKYQLTNTRFCITNMWRAYKRNACDFKK